MRKRLQASFTVESSFIIPIFIFIILALMASGFYARNVIMIKAFAWKEGIRLEHMSSTESRSRSQVAVFQDLKDEIRENSVFLKNVNVSISSGNNADTTIKIIGENSLSVPVFFSVAGIEITEKIKANNPAADLRKWHGLQRVMENAR